MISNKPTKSHMDPNNANAIHEGELGEAAAATNV
jgi:hypothetical protein